MKILIVEDESVIRRGCRMILEEKGHTVETCLTCREGIAAVTGNLYDLILLDMKLPDKNGTEVLKIVNNDQNDHRIIIMSGYAKVNLAVNAIKQGIVGYLPKPFTDDELLAAVETVTKKH